MEKEAVSLSAFNSVLGYLWVMATQKGIFRLDFRDDEPAAADIKHLEESLGVKIILENSIIIRQTEEQLKQYFDSERKVFNIPLDIRGTGFQKKVWEALLTIRYGETRTYMDQAKQLGDPKAVRAVAHANGLNPVAIIIPCHRIIGSNGDLTGYAGGLHRKRWLLEHESRQTTLF